MKKIHKVKLGPEQVESFQKLFMESSGLFVEKRRVLELERAITGRMVSLGTFKYNEYYKHLRNHLSLKGELGHLVRALTVGETHFFRTPPQFEALRSCILPEMIRKKESGEKKLRFLSAGCATGEEPYSLVILLLETFPELEDWQVDVIACDINDEFLERAKSGIYSERKLRLVPPQILKQYFSQRGEMYEISDDVKNRVEFRHFNLSNFDYSLLIEAGDFDVVLCRNVLIYFKEKTVRKVVKKLHEILVDEGYLILGYSETLFHMSDNFRSIHTDEAFFFQKTAARPVPTPEPRVPLPERPLVREDMLRTIGSRPYSGPRLEQPRPALTLPESVSRDDEEKLWEQGMEHFSREEFNLARDVFEKIISRDPDSAEGQIGMGLIFANRGEDDKAQGACERAKELDELLPELHLLQAFLDEKNSRLKNAMKNYQRVLWLDPEYIIAYFNLGNLYLSMDRKDDARREFRNALRILDGKGDHFSLCFSGGLGREALIQFCREQVVSGEDSVQGVSRLER